MAFVDILTWCGEVGSWQAEVANIARAKIGTFYIHTHTQRAAQHWRILHFNAAPATASRSWHAFIDVITRHIGISFKSTAA